ncbi:MAG: 7-carboxy-7-deazaguanine synthase [Candidatus Rifleibacterium amylolyticum]|nr:MAG: 7-carboxy-7-deazaguanine synthase [Candidatus Rifleibacterium amylolyticum]
MKMVNSRAEVSEVFASIQGEGLFLGSMQLFIRFGSATHDCRNKTTNHDEIPNQDFWFRTLPGTRNSRGKSPVTAHKLYKGIVKFFPLEQFFCISMIGEEPLLHADFLADFLALLKRDNLKTFVQTSVPSAKDFARIVGMLDFICLNIELPKKENGKELTRLASIIEMTSPDSTYLRLTVDAHENPHILLARLAMLPISRYTLILQPKMTGLSHISDWDTGTILEWINLFAPLFAHIRWIPQVHKLLRIP